MTDLLFLLHARPFFLVLLPIWPLLVRHVVQLPMNIFPIALGRLANRFDPLVLVWTAVGSSIPIVCLMVPMACISCLLLWVYDLWAGWLLCRSSISMHKSMTLVHRWFRLVFFVGFFRIDTFGSFLMASLLSVIVLGHKALQYEPNVLIVSLTHLLCSHSVRVAVCFAQGWIEPFCDVSTWLPHCCSTI